MNNEKCLVRVIYKGELENLKIVPKDHKEQWIICKCKPFINDGFYLLFTESGREVHINIDIIGMLLIEESNPEKSIDELRKEYLEKVLI